jgi:hypothetical protein
VLNDVASVMSFLLAVTLCASPEGLSELAARSAAQARELEAPMAFAVTGSPESLRAAFEAHLGSALANAKKAPVRVEAGITEEQARATGTRSLLRVTVSLEGNAIHVRGDGFSTWVNLWAGAVPTRAPGAAVIALEVPADPPSRLLSGAGPASRGLTLSVNTVLALPAVPSGLAAGDVDGDGVDEIAVLVGESIWLLSPSGHVWGKADVTAAPVSETPCREPFGWVAVSRGRVTAWSARRAKPVSWAVSRSGFGPPQLVDDFRSGDVAVSLEPGVNRLRGSWRNKPLGPDSWLQHVSIGTKYAMLAGADGSACVTATGECGNRLRGVGTGSVLTDFNADGVDEVLVSSARIQGDTDVIKALSLDSTLAAQARGATAAEIPTLWEASVPGRALVASAVRLDAATSAVVVGLWHGSTGALALVRRE